VNRSYLPFVDWLKCLGMVLILYGHLAGWAPLAAFAPIYSKQLGVAFFLFASGYSLSRETGDRWRVAFNRLFELYLFGLAVAGLVSVIALGTGARPQLSNYYPFLAGMNVLFNNFPANPTSWYLGTYVHVILLWALVGFRLQVTTRLLMISVVVEIVVRAVLMQTAGRFIAYMLVANWLTVLLLGYGYGQWREGNRPARDGMKVWMPSSATAIGALITVLLVWSLVSTRVGFERTFPFMTLTAAGPVAGAVLVSAIVSAVYVGITWLFVRSIEPMPAPWPVRFVARNTLIIFLGHMPILGVMEPIVKGWTDSAPLQSAVYMLVCLPGLAIVSEGLRRVVRPRELRDRLYARLSPSVTSETALQPH
jgi:peptidoglycan/LPS O-acetylase OafA/YrhL